MPNSIPLGLVLAACAFAASAQVSDIAAPTSHSAYLQDSRGIIARSGSGLCWRTGYWTPADAIAGCDGELVPPVVKPTAPTIVPPPLAAPAQPVPVRQRCDFSVTLQGEEAFDFNRTTLTKAAQQRLAQDVIPRLGACGKIETIRVTGHTDHLGLPEYNRKLSEKRAASVAAYLKNRGVTTPMEITGAGEDSPVQACDDKLSRRQLIECLAPNRRVVVEIRGWND